MMRKFLINTYILCFIFYSNAQKIERFEDQFGTQGQLRHQGTSSDTLLPKNGVFELQWREVNTPFLTTYLTKGTLKDHLPTGSWVWEQANWKHRIHVSSGISPLFHSEGERAKWIGSFKNGLPEGKWIYTLDSITHNGQIKSKLLRIEIAYKDGIPAGAFKVEQFGTKIPIKLNGQTSNGLATGIWKVTYKSNKGSNFTEERHYKEGFLLEIKTTDGVNKSSKQFHDNQRYFALKEKENVPFQIGALQFDSDHSNSFISEWLKQQLVSHFQNGWSLAQFPHELSFSTPMYKRLEYPFTPREQEQRATILADIKSQQEQIAHALVDHMEIHRTRSATLDTTVTFLDLVSNRLSLADSFMQETNRTIFMYQTREISNFKPFVSELTSVNKGHGKIYDSLSIELSSAAFSDSSQTIFDALIEMLRTQKELLPSYIKVVEDANLSVKQEVALQNLEEDILKKLAIQQAFYSNQEGLTHELFTRWIEKEIPYLLQKYAQADVYEDAKKIGQNILVHLDSLQSWQNQSLILDKADSTLLATYTLLAYNPYSGANDISMVAKKRFLSTISTQFWPYLITKLSASENWDEWANQWAQTWKYYNYLVRFASMDDKNAKRVEQKIRSEKKSERILKIIDNHLEDLEKMSH